MDTPRRSTRLFKKPNNTDSIIKTPATLNTPNSAAKSVSARTHKNVKILVVDYDAEKGDEIPGTPKLIGEKTRTSRKLAIDDSFKNVAQDISSNIHDTSTIRASATKQSPRKRRVRKTSEASEERKIVATDMELELKIDSPSETVAPVDIKNAVSNEVSLTRKSVSQRKSKVNRTTGKKIKSGVNKKSVSLLLEPVAHSAGNFSNYEPSSSENETQAKNLLLEQYSMEVTLAEKGDEIPDTPKLNGEKTRTSRKLVIDDSFKNVAQDISSNIHDTSTIGASATKQSTRKRRVRKTTEASEVNKIVATDMESELKIDSPSETVAPVDIKNAESNEVSLTRKSVPQRKVKVNRTTGKKIKSGVNKKSVSLLLEPEAHSASNISNYEPSSSENEEKAKHSMEVTLALNDSNNHSNAPKDLEITNPGTIKSKPEKTLASENEQDESEMKGVLIYSDVVSAEVVILPEVQPTNVISNYESPSSENEAQAKNPLLEQYSMEVTLALNDSNNSLNAPNDLEITNASTIKSQPENTQVSENKENDSEKKGVLSYSDVVSAEVVILPEAQSAINISNYESTSSKNDIMAKNPCFEQNSIALNDSNNHSNATKDLEFNNAEQNDSEIKGAPIYSDVVNAEVGILPKAIVNDENLLVDESCILLSDTSDVLSNTFTKDDQESIVQNPVMDSTFSPIKEGANPINDETFSPVQEDEEDNVRIPRKISIIEIFDTPVTKRTSTPKLKHLDSIKKMSLSKQSNDFVSLSFSSTATPPRIYNIVKPVVSVRKTPVNTLPPVSKTLKRLNTPRGNVNNLSNAKVISALKKIIQPSADKEPLKSCRKRSLSISDAETIKKHNRVTFHSPMNKTVEIDVLDQQMHQSFVMEKETQHSLGTLSPKRREKRSLSVTHSNISTSEGTPKKLVKPLQMPNFAAIHAKNFQKMESIVDYTLRKTERSKNILHAPLSNNKKVLGPIFEPNVFKISKIPLKKDTTIVPTSFVPPIMNIPKSHVDSRREKLIRDYKKKPTETVREASKRRATIIKGVRTNRRFELQMNMRKGLSEN